MPVKLKFSIIFGIFSSFLFFSFPSLIFSQVLNESNSSKKNTIQEDYKLFIKKAKGDISIDGNLNEPDWQAADIAKDFHRVLPIDTGYAISPTEVRLTYNEKYFFVGVKCFESIKGNNIVESLRRDFSFPANDNFLLFMDTYNDQTNGFSFGASAGGAQWDGLQADGGFVSLEWDCKWDSKVKHFEDHWTIEMAIPFKSLQFKTGINRWGINFSRLDLKQNEKSSWTPVPRQFQTASLAFTGSIIWDSPPPKPKNNLSLIPYILTGVSKDYANNLTINKELNVGMDAKISVSSSVNLDLTVNPDFSQVDVDEQVTNLDRYELFFPEKRRFFLENKDLFSSYGKKDIRPFFSRRIGLESPVKAGIRLSGKINEQWRLGLLNMQTGQKGFVPASNYTVATVQRRIFTRSSIGVFLINKQITSDQADLIESGENYNRVFGVDYNLASKDNRWVGKFFLHKSFTANKKNNSTALSTNLVYNTQQLKAEWNYDLVGENFLAETGYVPRNAFHRLTPALAYKFYPKSKTIANHGPVLSGGFIFDPKMNLTDKDIRFAYGIEFLNRSKIELSTKSQYIKLLDAFDPTHTGQKELELGSEYNWQVVELEYQSDARKLFNYNIEIGYGGFFNGDRLDISGSINYRFQPYGSIALKYSYNNLKFPEPFNDMDFFLIGPKLDITFTNKLFLTAFVQYNEQIDNINTNIRFQWRYLPVSDLFIVYSENYLPYNIHVKNRAIVAKFSYWFN